MTLGLALRAPDRDEGSANQGFEAIYTAAYRGHPPALVWIAEANDTSLEGDPGRMGASRNPLTAIEYYRRAEEAGETSAASRRAHLCDWLKERRFSGDDRARQAWAQGCGGS